MKVTITNLTELTNHDTTLAVMDAALPELNLTIHHIKIVNGRNGLFATLPTCGQKTAAGKWLFSPALTLPDDIQKEILKSAMQTFKAQREGDDDATDVPF